jgi:mevalonate pyrophosphate decarboxylase
MMSDKYHVGFTNQLTDKKSDVEIYYTMDTGKKIYVVHICKSETGEVVAFAKSNEFAKKIVGLLNKGDL